MTEKPGHIAIILDGNGRWAKKRNLPRSAGHRQGAITLRKLAEDMNDAGYKILTVYAFSTENWRRPTIEVNAIMLLLEEYIADYIKDTDQNNMRVNFFGGMGALESSLLVKIARLNTLTKNKPGMTLNIAINYGGRDEIVRALERKEDAEDQRPVTDDVLSTYMDLAEFPDPDMIIRTSGEYRLSGFLLWQSAYAELYFTDTLWPDFTINDLNAAVEWYNGRERRFGGVRRKRGIND